MTLGPVVEALRDPSRESGQVCGLCDEPKHWTDIRWRWTETGERICQECCEALVLAEVECTLAEVKRLKGERAELERRLRERGPGR